MPTPPPTATGPRSRKREESGFALLLVMLLLLILGPFAYEFTAQVQLEAMTAANVSDQLKVANEMDGQYEVMLARLRFDAGENEIDSYDDSWNDDELTSRQEAETEVAINTTMFDETAKFSLRQLHEGPVERQALAKERLRRLLVEYRRDTDFELSASEAESWAQQIAEYIAKGGVRQGIPTPRMTDQRRILVLEELHFLPDVSGHAFSFILYDQREDDHVAPGLHRFLTVYGSGKVNLNTTSEELLRAYFPINPELAERIVERRDNPPEDEEGMAQSSEDDGESSGNPYTEVVQITQVEGVTPESLQANQVDPNLDFDVKSDFFSFRVLGETRTTRRDEFFVVERVPANSQDDPLEGFRLLLRQERIDPLENLDEAE